MDYIGAMLWCVGVPALVVAGIVIFVESIRAAVSTRGVESGAFHCTKCRYNLHGITSWRCPECGQDPRVLGVLTRKRPMLSSFSWALIYLGTFPMFTLVTAASFDMIDERALGFGFLIGLALWLVLMICIAARWDARYRKRKKQERLQLCRFAEVNGLPMPDADRSSTADS